MPKSNRGGLSSFSSASSAASAAPSTDRSTAKPRLYRLTHLNGIEVLEKLNVVGRRRIHGIATTPTITANKTRSSSRGCHVKMPVPLLFGHEEYNGRMLPIGEVYLVQKCDHRVYVRAVLFDDSAAADHAWGLIERGDVRALSVGRKDQQVGGVVDGIKFIDRWTLKEVSICRRAANPDAYFEILRDHR